MHVNYSFVNGHSFARLLKEEAGYTVGMFGKYLNEMPSEVPPGYDAWFANSGGTYIAPSFMTKNIDGLPDGQVKFNNDPANYSTSVIGNVSLSWIRKVATDRRPFMAYIAPKAAHEPFNPAIWYADFWDPSWPQHEPRAENWNCSFESRKGHHGNIATQRLITEEASRVITGVFKNRWRTLMSVDDLVADVIGAVEELGLSDSTYFFFSSDHGFQLGQFNIPMDKRQVYEWDTKIHLLARGPGIPAGSVMPMAGTQVDIAPTLLGLAGVQAPPDMDGRSIAPFLLNAGDPTVPLSAKRHIENLGDANLYKMRWRDEVFIEYYFVDKNVKCVSGCGAGSYPVRDASCGNLADNSDCWCPDTLGGKNCYTTETMENNFIALRNVKTHELYAEFQGGSQSDKNINFDEIDYVEYYHLPSDPLQMRNLANATPKAELNALHAKLHQWFRCTGASCPR